MVFPFLEVSMVHLEIDAVRPPNIGCRMAHALVKSEFACLGARGLSQPKEGPSRGPRQQKPPQRGCGGMKRTATLSGLGDGGTANPG